MPITTTADNNFYLLFYFSEKFYLVLLGLNLVSKDTNPIINSVSFLYP